MSKNINDSFKDTLLSSNLPGLIQELGEIGIDTLIERGVLKDIPILGSITAICSAFGSVRDFQLTKRLSDFLMEISSLSKEQRVELISKMDADKEFNESVGEKVIGILSRADDERKPALIAKAFKLYAKGELNYLQLQRISYAIERLLLCDLKELEVFCATDAMRELPRESAVYANFINAGIGFIAAGFGGGGIRPTETAPLLLKVIKS